MLARMHAHNTSQHDVNQQRTYHSRIRVVVTQSIKVSRWETQEMRTVLIRFTCYFARNSATNCFEALPWPSHKSLTRAHQFSNQLRSGRLTRSWRMLSEQQTLPGQPVARAPALRR